MTGMVEKAEWSLASKQKYDFQAIRVRISELIPTGAKPRMYRVGRNTLVKALKNRITQASEGRSVTLIDSRTRKEVSELDSIADLVPIDALTDSSSRLGPVVELKLDWGKVSTEPSNACRPVRSARVFHRNVRECISAAKTGTHPAKRPRHSAEEGPSVKRPRVEHFVQLAWVARQISVG
ncbi:Oidioi.mRNA.OKI2018_I69.chr1.g2875.t2.cds [Oikopleura dioica]|uniref:Oidioi.mRNA.OKI2018_I69.chr1.g2875.t2.cds n=1 Tax=Oikopleura dioica TaxID=34765 RepID=A0ABN7SU63_OIKDI|nr:Oidioi.mRNA.OKI2018_I69.chr1.g2875.t2.cds [Oikopleura dioica]